MLYISSLWVNNLITPKLYEKTNNNKLQFQYFISKIRTNNIFIRIVRVSKVLAFMRFEFGFFRKHSYAKNVSYKRTLSVSPVLSGMFSYLWISFLGLMLLILTTLWWFLKCFQVYSAFLRILSCSDVSSYLLNGSFGGYISNGASSCISFCLWTSAATEFECSPSVTETSWFCSFKFLNLNIVNVTGNFIPEIYVINIWTTLIFPE